MKINIRYVQLALEAFIPLAGFFFWDWSLYFILLFYFIDLIASEVIMHLKAKKIATHHEEESKPVWLRYGIFSGALFILTLLVIHLAMIFVVPGIDFFKEIIAFWVYEEMGIQQGILLVPLVAFSSYQQYKMEFLMPAKYRSLKMKPLWKSHMTALLTMLAFAGIALGLSQFILLPEIVYVLGIVILSAVYSLTVKP